MRGRPVPLVRLQFPQSRAFTVRASKPLVNRGAIHRIARDNVAQASSFAHTLNGHQPYRLLCYSIKLAAIYFHKIYDHGDDLKYPNVSTYLLTHK